MYYEIYYIHILHQYIFNCHTRCYTHMNRSILVWSHTSCYSVYIFTYICSYCTVWKFSEFWWSWQVTIRLKSSHFSATIIPLYIWGWIYPIAKLFITKTFIRVNSPNPSTSYNCNYMVIILFAKTFTKWLSKQFLMFTSISFYIASYMSATVLKLVSNSFLIFCIIMPKMLNLFNLTVINYMFIWYNIQLVQNTIMLYNDIIYL